MQAVSSIHRATAYPLLFNDWLNTRIFFGQTETHRSHALHFFSLNTGLGTPPLPIVLFIVLLTTVSTMAAPTPTRRRQLDDTPRHHPG